MARTLLSGFYQALEQSTVQLRELTVRGDAIERVWAIWALALREGRGAHPALLTALESEPNPGTRSLCVTVLAGFRDLATLRTIAARDPAAIVRETACQALTRIDGHDLATIDLLLFRMDHDAAPQVRAAVVLELPASAPAVAFERCAGRLRDSDVGVRQAAARRLATHQNLSKDVGDAFALLAALDSDWCLRILDCSGGIASLATLAELARELHDSAPADSASEPREDSRSNKASAPRVRQRPSRHELDESLKYHRMWVESFCCEGACAELEDADLRAAALRDANFCCAGLSGADLSMADLRGANLQNADLKNAQLRYTNLRDADLRGAELKGANFEGANLQNTLF
jgi:hypothetical protein